MRLDKWLWAARCFKTRGLAAEAADRERVRVNDLPAKPAKELRVGDRLYCMACMTRLVVVAGDGGRLEAQVVY